MYILYFYRHCLYSITNSDEWDYNHVCEREGYKKRLTLTTHLIKSQGKNLQYHLFSILSFSATDISNLN